jgi:hypothetical protein
MGKFDRQIICEIKNVQAYDELLKIQENGLERIEVSIRKQIIIIVVIRPIIINR